MCLNIRLILILWLTLNSVTGHSANNTTAEKVSIQVVGWIGSETYKHMSIIIFILIAAIAKLTYHKFENYLSFIPESLLLIVLGILTGLLVRYNMSSRVLNFSPDLFFLILLPPIVLDSAYCLYSRTFGEILGIVIIMAVLGTVLCFLFIGFSLYGLEVAGALGTGSPVGANIGAVLLFSSLIVAVDPVAVLAIFKDLKVDKELYYMVFGESLFNDAVTIVLYDIVEAFLKAGPENVTAPNILLGLVSFFTVSGGGILIGVLIGFISSLLTRFQSKNCLHTITLISTAYTAYLIAYTLKWSGIVAMIACGIVQASYAFQNISPTTLTTLRQAVEQIAIVAESIIFVFLGLELLIMNLYWHLGFILWSIVLCLVSRFMVTFCLVSCINYVRVDQRKLSLTEFFIMFYGGLRGAVAFSLAILIEEEFLTDQGNGKDIKKLFVTSTLVIILFTVAIMGTTMKPLARLLRVKTEKKRILSLYNELNNSLLDNLMSGVEIIADQRGRNQLRTFICKLDTQYIRPFLVNDPQQNATFKILKCYQEISLALHYAAIEKSEKKEQHLNPLPQTLWPNFKAKKSFISRQQMSIKKSNQTENIEMDVIQQFRKLTQSSKEDVELHPTKFSSLLEQSFERKFYDVFHSCNNRNSSISELTNFSSLPNRPKSVSFSQVELARRRNTSRLKSLTENVDDNEVEDVNCSDGHDNVAYEDDVESGNHLMTQF